MNKEFSGEGVWKNRTPRGSKMRNLLKGGGGVIACVSNAYAMIFERCMINN